MNKLEKVRFAPSPTGHLHIGGARTALFNYLEAKNKGGTFLLRIEDTDEGRSTKESEAVIIEDLRWLGINWNEGIEVGGDHGPYRCTERPEIYKEYLGALLESGKAYKCYCTAEETEAERETQRANGEMPRYVGKCRDLSKEQIEAYEAEGRVPTIRFRVPADMDIVIHDKVRGEVVFDSNGVGDYIIAKANGTPVYNFAVSIDDHLMEITTVIRGEEHLSNTPRQVLIYQAFGWEPPKFAHVSLILGEDRSKMSKRHGSTHVDQYRNKGYLPEAIINFLALLGWSPEGEEEMFTLQELEEIFTLDRVSKNPAVFDVKKLNWINGQYIRASDLDYITKLCIPYLLEAGLVTDKDVEERYDWIKMVVSATRGNLEYLAQITEHVGIFFSETIELENDEARQVLALEHVKVVLESFKEKVMAADHIDLEFAKAVFKEVQKDTGIKGKNLFMTVRVALTGQCHGPEMPDIIQILGKEGMVKRINTFI
ncbi:MAG TPA: glutamate--tRNA ligase [Epulopiscium sp.]|nr:glutamate--tRNA ligase [Candidatus Epulonipiscium sp.]